MAPFDAPRILRLRRGGGDAWVRSGEPWIWLTGVALALGICAVVGAIGLIAGHGLGHFWPADVYVWELAEEAGAGPRLIGEPVGRERLSARRFEEITGREAAGDRFERLIIRTGNRRTAPPDFRRVYAQDVRSRSADPRLTVVERRAWGPAYGLLRDDGGLGLGKASPHAGAGAARAGTLVLERADGALLRIAVADVVQAWQPNRMSVLAKTKHYFRNLWRFLSSYPREANTEGGIYPAIHGTVLMVLLMSVLVTPLGVLTAVYLHEYAGSGPVVRLVRISVNNLAGVPSIVYGVFGLGFFVYVVGGTLDSWFFADRLPAPTFGTPGLLWASVTLALLTLPVVIVATEEGLGRIPNSLREGSFALGATRAETLLRVVLPAARPAVLTGIILAVGRAAGEVAPLMLVGVVKLAPALPLDGEFPYLHLERKFMHLGFHIYDLGFQSPNAEAARPLLYATALLLVLVIVSLNLAAMLLRNALEKRYRPPLV